GLGSAVRTREGLGVAVGLELVLQAPEADPQQPRRLRPVPSHPVQRLQNVLLLQLTQRQPRRQPRLGGLDAALSRSVAQREDVDVDRVVLAQDHRLLDTVLQLPHIARPLRPHHHPPAAPAPPPCAAPPVWGPPPKPPPQNAPPPPQSPPAAPAAAAPRSSPPLSDSTDPPETPPPAPPAANPCSTP